jgi:hypothetical protein
MYYGKPCIGVTAGAVASIVSYVGGWTFRRVFAQS